MYSCAIATMTYEGFHSQLAVEGYMRSEGLGFCPSSVANRHREFGLDSVTLKLFSFR